MTWDEQNNSWKTCSCAGKKGIWESPENSKPIIFQVPMNRFVKSGVKQIFARPNVIALGLSTAIADDLISQGLAIAANPPFLLAGYDAR